MEAEFAGHLRIGDVLVLQKEGIRIERTVADFPGDNSVVTLEPPFPDDDEDSIIHGIDESEGWDYGWIDDRPVEVGWHIDGWEVVEIRRIGQ